MDIETNESNLKIATKKSKNKMYVIVIIALLIMGIGLGSWYYIHSTNVAEEKQQYKEDLESVVSQMIYSGTDVSEVVTYYTLWWNNFNESGGVISFKDSKGNTTKFDDLDSFILNRVENNNKEIDQIIDNRSNIINKLNLLNTPPEEYKDLFEVSLEIYLLYSDYSSLAEYPVGTFNSFTSKANDLLEEILRKKKEFDIRLPTN